MPCTEGSVEDASEIRRHRVLQAGWWFAVPRWCPAPRSVGRHYRLPQKQINASPPSLPPPLLPTRSSHHLSGHRGGSPGGARWRRDTGACHLLPAPAGVEEDGAEQPGLPHPLSLPDWGRVWAPREGKSVSKNHSHLQGGSGGVFEIA